MSESFSFAFQKPGAASKISAPAQPGVQAKTSQERSSHCEETQAVPGDPAVTFRRTATRADLLDAVYTSCASLSRHQAREIFEMALEEVSQTLASGESVKLRSFGLFSVREKRERVGRNPRTGEEVPIKPRRVLTFKASPVLLDKLNGADGGKAEIED